jgi:hypothetical protein
VNSHELAKLLLSRRANDIRIEVLVDEDPDADYEPQMTSLRDAGDGNGNPISTTIPADQIVVYDSEEDVIVIRAGVIVAGDMEA